MGYKNYCMAWKWNWAICHQLMIIFLKNSACSGKYSKSSSLVTQTKSSHFPMLNFWASTTWDLKKNRWQKEKHRLGKQHTLEGTPSEVHVCNQYEIGIDWNGKQKQALHQYVKRKIQPFWSKYLIRFRDILCLLYNHVPHRSISNKVSVRKVSNHRF